MAKLGDTAVYTIPDKLRTKTQKGKVELSGSIYHPEFDRFAATVASDPIPSSDPKVLHHHLALHVPGRPTQWALAGEGDGPGQFKVVKR